MAFQMIYNSTNLLIERETVPSSGTGTDEDPFVYPERRTWKKVQQDNPNIIDQFDDPRAQLIINKVADFEALVTLIENSPDVTAGNIIAQFQALKDELPDIINALIFLGKRQLEVD